MSWTGFIWITYNFKSSTSKRKNNITCTEKIQKAFIKKTQGLSMVSGDVDVTTLSKLFNLKSKQCVSAFIYYLKELFTSCVKQGFSKVWSDSTTSSSLGSSWSSQCSVNLATRCVQQLFQVYLQLDFRLYLVSNKYCLFYPGCDLCANCQKAESMWTLITFAKLDIHEAEWLVWNKLVYSLQSKYWFIFILASVLKSVIQSPRDCSTASDSACVEIKWSLLCLMQKFPACI